MDSTMAAATERNDDSTMNVCAARDPQTGRRPRKRKRRREGGRRWSISISSTSTALASLMTFLVLNLNHHNHHSLITAVGATSSSSSSTPYEQDPQTDLWLDAEGDLEDDDSKKEKKEKEHNDSLLPPKEEKSDEEEREHTREEELQLHAQQLEHSKEKFNKEKNINAKEQQQHQQFMDWCHQVLGIQTSLEIHTFYYYDYMTAIMTYPDPADTDNDDDDDNFLPSIERNKTRPEDDFKDPPMIPVRGLRATRNITKGEVVISIPFQALLTVSTTIDQDPVLGRVMGREAREAHGWTLGQDVSSTEKEVDFFELPLLAMALLHHYKLGTSSPLYPYIHLLRKSPIHQMPYLWSKQKRQKQYANASRVAKGIQTVGRSVRLEMKDMYHTVIDVLVKKHPELFGRGQTQQYDTIDEWAFSFENFQWAFAMVNSRHWLLPIVDLEQAKNTHSARQKQKVHPHYPAPAASPRNTPMAGVDGVPPAEMPTDEWVTVQEEFEEEEEEVEAVETRPEDTINNLPPSYHSFLAPVADLLNFGPPCTRGRYNQETHTFDIIASCDFVPGQEVTFWYSDECEEIVVGNYGFSHPMVPKCPTLEDHRLGRDKWKQRALSLQQALEEAYEDMDIMDTELQNVQTVLANCDCCQDTARVRHYPLPEEQNRHDENALPKPQTQQKPSKQQHTNLAPSHGQGSRGNHNHNLRNPASAKSPIRGGRGNLAMVRRESNRGSSRSNHHRPNEDRRPRDDDEVEHHGVRRMWASRSL